MNAHWTGFGVDLSKIPRRRTRGIGRGDPETLHKAREMARELANRLRTVQPRVYWGTKDRTQSAYRHRDWAIFLRRYPKWSSEVEYTILHEFAHHFMHERYRGLVTIGRVFPHGPLFTRALAKVILAWNREITSKVPEYGEVHRELRTKHPDAYRLVEHALLGHAEWYVRRVKSEVIK